MMTRGTAEEEIVAEERVNVLLVDDRPEDLSALRSVLGGSGYDLVTALGPQQALRALLDRDFAVILMDVRMPGMDGLELAQLIKERERTRHTPIIFMTADSTDLRQLYRGYSVGAVDYLVKPVEPLVVSAKVRIFADLFRKDQRLKRQAEALRQAERREREHALVQASQAAERRYRNLAEAIPNIVFTALPDGSIDYCNRCWFDYTEMTLERTRGLGWLEVVHPDDRARCARAWQSAVERGEMFEVECRLLRGSDLTYRWHVGHAVPEHDEQGKIISWLGTYTDFEELKQAICARDEFLSIASHELRTPLTALKLRVHSLQRSPGLDEKLSRHVQGAMRQIDRLERLIESLLDVSRIATGRMLLQPEGIELVELVRGVMARVQAESPPGSADLHLDAPESLEGSWDRVRLEQVVSSLLSNAVKYGEQKPIEVTLSGGEERVQISVRDHGVGIAPEHLERIFRQFERVAEGRRQGGLGLGLYITRRIVAAHGGSIEARSRPGQGSVFTVELPRKTRKTG